MVPTFVMHYCKVSALKMLHVSVLGMLISCVLVSVLLLVGGFLTRFLNKS
jgi:hypothetical protein